MKLGQAMYEAQQQSAGAAPEADAASSGDGASSGQPREEEVVDAEFSEVDDENKANG
jgi:molecular chaperone DnaK